MALSKPSLLQILQWFQMYHSDRTLLAFKDRETGIGTRARGRGKAQGRQALYRLSRGTGKLRRLSSWKKTGLFKCLLTFKAQI